MDSISLDSFRQISAGSYNLGSVVVEEGKDGTSALRKIDNHASFFGRLFNAVRDPNSKFETNGSALKNVQARKALLSALTADAHKLYGTNDAIEKFLSNVRERLLGDKATTSLSREGDIAKIINDYDQNRLTWKPISGRTFKACDPNVELGNSVKGIFNKVQSAIKDIVNNGGKATTAMSKRYAEGAAMLVDINSKQVETLVRTRSESINAFLKLDLLDQMDSLKVDIEKMKAKGMTDDHLAMTFLARALSFSLRGDLPEDAQGGEVAPSQPQAGEIKPGAEKAPDPANATNPNPVNAAVPNPVKAPKPVAAPKIGVTELEATLKTDVVKELKAKTDFTSDLILAMAKDNDMCREMYLETEQLNKFLKYEFETNSGLAQSIEKEIGAEKTNLINEFEKGTLSAKFSAPASVDEVFNVLQDKLLEKIVLRLTGEGSDGDELGKTYVSSAKKFFADPPGATEKDRLLLRFCSHFRKFEASGLNPVSPAEDALISCKPKLAEKVLTDVFGVNVEELDGDQIDILANFFMGHAETVAATNVDAVATSEPYQKAYKTIGELVKSGELGRGLDAASCTQFTNLLTYASNFGFKSNFEAAKLLKELKASGTGINVLLQKMAAKKEVFYQLFELNGNSFVGLDAFCKRALKKNVADVVKSDLFTGKNNDPIEIKDPFDSLRTVEKNLVNIFLGYDLPSAAAARGNGPLSRADITSVLTALTQLEKKEAGTEQEISVKLSAGKVKIVSGKDGALTIHAGKPEDNISFSVPQTPAQIRQRIVNDIVSHTSKFGRDTVRDILKDVTGNSAGERELYTRILIDIHGVDAMSLFNVSTEKLNKAAHDCLDGKPVNIDDLTRMPERGKLHENNGFSAMSMSVFNNYKGNEKEADKVVTYEAPVVPEDDSSELVAVLKSIRTDNSNASSEGQSVAPRAVIHGFLKKAQEAGVLEQLLFPSSDPNAQTPLNKFVESPRAEELLEPVFKSEFFSQAPLNLFKSVAGLRTLAKQVLQAVTLNDKYDDAALKDAIGDFVKVFESQDSFNDRLAALNKKIDNLKAEIGEQNGIIEKNKPSESDSVINKGVKAVAKLAAEAQKKVLEAQLAKLEPIYNTLSDKDNKVLTSVANALNALVNPVGTISNKINDRVGGLLSPGKKEVKNTELWEQSLDELAKGAVFNPESGYGKYVINVVKTYLSGLDKEDSDRIINKAIQEAVGGSHAKPLDILRAALKQTDPVLLKILQGIPDEALRGTPLEGLFDDFKSKLEPIPADFVKAQLYSLVQRSNGAIKSIKVDKVLGAASVAQAFLCTAITAEHPEGEELVVKIQRPDAANRLLAAERIFRKAAADVSEGMKITFEGQLARIKEEFDFMRESDNVLRGIVYNGKKNNGLYDTVRSMELSPLVPPSTDVMVLKKAPGVTVDKLVENAKTRRLELEKSSEMSDSKKASTLKQLRGDLLQKQTYISNLVTVWTEETFFRSGFYHGDLHAGNMVVDNRGVTVIDYGNATRLTESERQAFMNMVGYCSIGDRDGFLETFESILSTSGKAVLSDKNTRTRILGELKEVFGKGNGDDSQNRLFAAISVLQRNGLETPAPIYNFIQCLIRLSDTMSSVAGEIAAIDRQVKAMGLDNPDMDTTKWTKPPTLADAICERLSIKRAISAVSTKTAIAMSWTKFTESDRISHEISRGKINDKALTEYVKTHKGKPSLKRRAEIEANLDELRCPTDFFSRISKSGWTKDKETVTLFKKVLALNLELAVGNQTEDDDFNDSVGYAMANFTANYPQLKTALMKLSPQDFQTLSESVKQDEPHLDALIKVALTA